MAVDGRNHRHFAIPQRLDYALNTPTIVAPSRVRRIERSDPVAFLHRLEIAAGRERSSPARQYDTADRRVIVRSRDGLDDVAAVLMRTDGVSNLGACEREGSHASVT